MRKGEVRTAKLLNKLKVRAADLFITKLNSNYMKQSVFQFIILLHPTKEQSEKGEKSKIIVPLTTILANDASAANIAAARAIPEEFIDKLDQVVLAIKPF